MFLGDMNYDMLVSEKSSALANICDIFDLHNLVKNPTCFTKQAAPSLNDVILTNTPKQCMKILDFNCGISDVHNCISVQFKGNVQQRKPVFKNYRSFKNISEEKFYFRSRKKIDFDTLLLDSNIDIAYNNFESAITETINTHAPMKKGKLSLNQHLL